MKVLNYSIIKLTLCIVIGILLGSFIAIPFTFTCLGFVGLLIVFIGVFRYPKKQWIQPAIFSLITYLLFINLGTLVWQLQEPQHQPTHYTNLVKLNAQVDIEGKVLSRLKSFNSFDNYIITVDNVNHIKSTGKLLLKVKKDSVQDPLQIDDVIAITTKLQHIAEPLNPHQFNYSNYMAHQNVLAQGYIEASEIFKTKPKTISYRGYALKARTYIINSLKAHGFKDDELGIVKALLLGQKDDISQNVYTSYVNAGVIHILAVSGLHVGILLGILQFVLSALFRFKYGKLIKTICILILLWGFAILAGLSPSVTRAVTMFSFLAIAFNLKRKTHVINTLFLSAFVLLLVNPQFLFSVGFQLSYLAVCSIVLLLPVLQGLLPRSKYYVVRLFYDVCCVTIAAQIGVLPLSLFYFHQFPGLFLLTNIVIIPFLSLILSYGILCIVLAILNILPEFVSSLFQDIIALMNTFISWVGAQKEFLITDIHFSELQTVVSYILIFTVLIALHNFKPKRYIYICIAFLIFQLGFIYENYKNNTAKEFIVFHQIAETAIGFQNGDTLVLNTSDVLQKNNALKTTISNYTIAKNIQHLKIDTLKSIVAYSKTKVFIIDSLGVYDSTFKNHVIVLRNSPKINLNRLIDSISPKLIIADGSNYKSYIKRWKHTTQIKKLPFHHTGEKGAFLIQD